jgi:hypothetical protein
MLSSFHPQIYSRPSADPGQVFGRILSKMSLLSRQAGLAWQEVNETPGGFTVGDLVSLFRHTLVLLNETMFHFITSLVDRQVTNIIRNVCHKSD